jgi:formic-like protein
VKSSKKFKSLLEVILAFGNYLNSSKRGPAYGFRLQSLDTLLDTKSTDKKISLLHYIVATIRQNFTDLLNFDSELFCIDKASQVSLENVITDVNELEKGMEVVRKEVVAVGKNAQFRREIEKDKCRYKSCTTKFQRVLRVLRRIVTKS